MFVRLSAVRFSLVLRAVVLCGWSILGGTMAAHAATATAKWTGYLRAGPGEQYAALDEVSAHDTFDVDRCADGWCRITYGGAQGYLAQGLVDQGPPSPIKPAAPGTKNCFRTTQNGYRGAEDVQICGE